jgi:hypothetical protein
MSNQEFETKRTARANAFAAAGARLLDYIGIADTAVAAIPDTQPEKYAVAGTLNGILSMAGKMMGEDGAEKTTASEEIAGVNIARLLRNLEETSYNEGAMDLACRLSDCHAVIKALLAAPAPVSQPTGDLTDDGAP